MGRTNRTMRAAALLVCLAAVAFAQDVDDKPKGGVSSKVPAPFKPRCMGNKPCNLPVEQKAILSKAMDTLEAAANAMNKEVVREPASTGCLNDCSFKGQCIHGECETCGPAYCQCNPGHTGADCSELACPKGCSGNGVCDGRTGTCSCFQGFAQTNNPDCSLVACAKNCSFHGECTAKGKCKCDEGFDGDDCESEMNSAKCSNKGTFTITKVDESEKEEGTCQCLPGFAGDTCEEKVCEKDCSGHGDCYNGTCKCDHLFTGKICEIALCKNNCSKHGECFNGTCRCAPKYEGKDCSELRCQCGQHGRCDNFECVCEQGWTGKKCDKCLCDRNCSGHGVCDTASDGNCSCACSAPETALAGASVIIPQALACVMLAIRVRSARSPSAQTTAHTLDGWTLKGAL